jgi:NADPH:quinone reductase
MKSIQVRETGGPEKLELVETATPQPGPGQALVRIAASGVNYIDVYYRTGLYKAGLPVTLGNEGAGTVQAAGAGVSEVAPGDRVAWAVASGSYAEYALVPAAQLVKLPAGLDFPTAAAVMLQGMTAHYLTHSTYALKSGDACLVHAAAGGAGGLIAQMAKMLGARVFGTVYECDPGTRSKAREYNRHHRGSQTTTAPSTRCTIVLCFRHHRFTVTSGPRLA